MVYYFCHCISLHVCPGDFFFYILDSRFADCWKETVFLAFHFGAVVLSVSFFPFSFLLSNCIDFWSLLPFCFDISCKLSP